MNELTGLFGACLKGSVAIMGVGNRLRGDDGAGSVLAERLRGKVPGAVLDCGEVPENYTDVVKRERPRTVVVVDAVEVGQEPGALAAFRSEDLVGPARPSTHHPSLGLLARYLGEETGAEVFLLGIQAKRTGFGEPMSEEVWHAVEMLEDILACCLGNGHEEALARGE